MSLEDKVMAGIKKAMLAKDEINLRSLRAIKNAILQAKTAEGAKGSVSEEEEIKILQKLVKQRKDSLEIYEQQGRSDLATKEAEEIKAISEFLPQQLSDEEIKEAVSRIMEDTGAKGMADMGKVMGAANKQLAGKADGKTIAAIVKDLLQQ